MNVSSSDSLPSSSSSAIQPFSQVASRPVGQSASRSVGRLQQMTNGLGLLVRTLLLLLLLTVISHKVDVAAEKLVLLSYAHQSAAAADRPQAAKG